MKYKFRATVPLTAFYECELEIEANSELEARDLLENMSYEKLDEIATDWEQNTDNANPDGDFEIHECIDKQEEFSDDLILEYNNLSELSYYDTKQELIDLYKGDLLVGYVEVWTDRENSNREYIVINNEIIYLDTITKLNNEDNKCL